MSAWKVCLVVLPALALAACGRSSAPGSPTQIQSAPQNAALSFGRLVAAAEPIPDGRLTRCLSGSGDAACFGASTLPQRRVSLAAPVSTGAATGSVDAADIAAPDPPTQLNSAVSRSATSATVFISWTKPATGPVPTDYMIEAGSTSGASDLASFKTGNSNTLFSTAVTGTSTFYVRVRSVTAGGVSAPSNEVVVTVVDPAIPGAPFGLRISVSGSTVTLSWFAPQNGGPATSYIVQASGTPGGPPTLANFATGNLNTSLTATNVAPGNYFVRVLAANSAGVGAPSTELSVIVFSSTPTCTAPPSAPSNLVSIVSGSTVTLGWSPGTGPISSYVVEAGSATGLANLAVADTGSTSGSAAFTGVGRGTYFVRIRSKNSCGVSAISNEIIVVVQ